MASAWGTSWGNSWGNAWGTISSNPGDMAASGGFTLTALASLTAQIASAGAAALVVSATGTLSGGVVSNDMAGSALFTFSAIGTISTPIEPAAPADRFNYGAQLSPALQGRYVGDPVIGRMAQRLRRNKRW